MTPLSRYSTKLLIALLLVAAVASIAIAGVSVSRASGALNISIHPSEDAIAMTWSTRDSETLSGYLLERKNPSSEDWSFLATVPSEYASYIDASVNASGKYKYRVTELHARAASPDRAVLNAEADHELPVPTGLTAVPVLDDTLTPTGVKLSWNSARVHGQKTAYNIWRNGSDLNGQPYFPYAGLEPDVENGRTWYLDTTAEAGETYTYTIQVLAGEQYWTVHQEYSSPWHADVTVTVPVDPDAPAAPTDVAVSIRKGVATISWTAPDADNITGYKVTRKSGDETSTVVESASGTSVKDSTIVAGTAYTYRVRTLSAAGNSPRSKPASITAPPAITGLTTTQSAGKIAVTWNEADAATSYKVTTNLHSKNDHSTIASSSSTTVDSASHTHTDIRPGRKLSYEVFAKSSDGSGPVSTVEVTLDAMPGKPSNLEISDLTHSIYLSWDDPSDDSVTGYQILRKSPSLGQNELTALVVDTGSSTTSYLDASAEPSQSYRYRVKAVSGAVIGPSSAPVGVRE
jgi:fibronectin type 3 domain-containing protein